MVELKKMTGAKMIMPEADAELLESGGKADFRFGDETGSRFTPVKVDQKLKDGDKVTLGGMELTAHMHPGHTKCATSFTFDVREAGKTYHVGLINMPGINPGVKVSGMPKLPGIAQAYANTFRLQKELKFDVWLSSHAGQFRMHEKYKPGDAYSPDRFLDFNGFRAALNRLEKLYLDQLAQERGGK